jgi:hypothetical protein
MSENDFHIELDPELEAKLEALDGVGKAAEATAQAIVATAQSIAPVQTGHYRDGITAEKTAVPGMWKVFGTDFKSAWIEFGVPNRGIPAQSIFRKAADILGLKIHSDKKDENK